MKAKPEIEKNTTTEEKIKEAARAVFVQKGYAATRTRDIAEASGYNLALINYYFRSKEKLFDIIVMEQIQLFVHSIQGIVNDEQTSLQQKLEILISHYIDMLVKHPYLPTFVLSEVNANPTKLLEKLGIKGHHKDAYIVKQWMEFAAKKKGKAPNPLHIALNVLSMTIFPFVASPLFRNRTGTSIEQFNKLMMERKILIPQWANMMLHTQLPDKETTH